jgi:hypothetical protein
MKIFIYLKTNCTPIYTVFTNYKDVSSLTEQSSDIMEQG